MNDTEILLLGGPFDGETMVVEEETGNLVWQNLIYKPIRGEEAGTSGV